MLESCFLIRLGRLLKEARATLGVLLTDLSATSRSDPPGTGSYYGKLGPACVSTVLLSISHGKREVRSARKKTRREGSAKRKRKAHPAVINQRPRYTL